MAKDHKRPGGYRYSSRVQNRFSHNTLAKTCSKDDSCWEEFTLNATRDNQTRRKGGYNPRTSHAHGVLQSSISSTKERRLISPSHRLKSLEQIHSERTFPNGKLNVHKAPLKRKRIYGQTRPKRRLPNGGRPSRVTEVPSVLLARPNLPVSSLAVRTKHGTTNIYETAKACGSLSSHSKYQTSHLPGRHTNYRVVSTNTKGTHSAGNRATSKPGLYHQLREVAVDPYSSTRVPRVLDKLENNEILPTSDKGSQSARSVQISPEGESNLTTPSRSASGFPRVLSTSSVVSPLALQASTELFNPTSSVEQGVVSGYRPPRPPSSRGAPVVDHQHQTGEWKPNSPPSDRDGDHLRRLQDGVGCHLRQSVNQRTLVKAGKRPPYQRLRAKSDLFSDTSFSEKSVESSGETPSRQHNSSDVCQQPRRYSFTQSHVIDTRTVELVPTTQHSDHCRTPPGCLECPGRQRVADIYRFQRLETTTTNNTIFPQGQRDRSLRHKTDQSIKELCELATRPTCCGDGRFFNRLESDERICVSTIQSHPTDIDEGYKRQCEHSASSTSVANPTLVATTATAHSPTSSTSPRIPNSSTRPVQSQGNPSNVPETATSRLDYFQQLCTTAGLSSTVTRLLSSATRQSTNKSYDCAWTKWNSWCNRRKVNPISATVKDILTFLSDQFDNNLQYRTVNVLRSAISSIHPWIEGKPVGQHPLVIRLMKGIANERPPKPRYTTTWDVAKVTTYLSALGENKTLSLKLLTKKLLMLLALVSPERASVLWELNIRYLKKTTGRCGVHTNQTT